MSENDDSGSKRPPRTSAEAGGSLTERLTSPTKSSGEPRQRSAGSPSAREIEGEVTSSMAPSPEAVAPAARPKRQVGKRQPVRTAKAAAQHEALMSSPPTEESHLVAQEDLGEVVDPAQVDPREDRFAEWQVSGMFILAMLATVGFIVAYLLISQHTNKGQYMNWALGGLLAVSLLGIGCGMVLWAKKLMPHDKAVQERHPFHSPEEEELEAEEIFFKGVAASGIGARKLVRRTLIGAMALFPLPVVLLLRDLGPLPHNSLRRSGWRKDSRLVDLTTRLPVRLGDLEIGGIQTVMPEGFGSPDAFALAPTVLIRFGPGQIRSAKELNWAADNHVAYSKICTHAGCPISLYEQQTHHLLCPCHQSTFQMDEDAKVIFGPAARPLPQLPIYVDSQGYFRTRSDYTEPVGPSFWERG